MLAIRQGEWNMLLRKLAVFTAAMMIAATAGQVRAADTWIKAESAHFVIYSDAPEKKTRTYVKKLEAFRALTNLLLGSGDSGPQVKFEIYLLNDGDQMLVVRPSFSRYVGGVYFNCAEGTSAYGAAQNGGDIMDEQDQSQITLFHEYSHYVMFQHARTYYPAWYVEGFAEYLSTADPKNGTISIGENNQGRSYLLAEDHWIGFDRVLNPDFGFTGDKSNDPTEIESFYAQSWLLTHFMLSDPARAKALNAYFAALGRGGDPIKSWEDTTGIKVATLHTTLDRYSSKMFYLNVPVADYPDSDIQVAPVAAGASLLDRSLLTTCMPPDQGKAVLARLQADRAAQPGDIDLALAATRAELLYGRIEDAETDAGALIDAHADNFDANYLMGRVYLKEAGAAKGQDRSDLMDAARGFFVAAYGINKLDAPNLYFLAQSYADKPGFPDQNTVNAANGAHVLAPGVGDYAMFAAFTDLATDKRDDAVSLLTPFVSDPHDRAAAERIQKAIDAIKAGKPVNDVMALLNAG